MFILKGSSSMNSNRRVEGHYLSIGFPYTNTENLMDLFDGLSYTQADMFLAESLQDQGNSYWSMMHANPYKYGFSGSIGNSYYNFSQLYDLNEYSPRLDGGRRLWDNSVTLSSIELPQIALDGPSGAEASSTPYSDERNRNSSSSSSPQQYVWQDNIDPDSMTYEELLDLGESVGTQSRGLSQEHISSLPVKKYKCSFFSRKKKQNERCVICQMEYKRGERQMTLPCKHVYHSGCVSRWLSLNKACPVCAAEVVPSDKKR